MGRRAAGRSRWCRRRSLDEDQLVARERGLVGVGGGYGLHLEGDGLEACVQEGRAKTFGGEVVVLGSFGADEADGASDGGGADRLAEMLLGAQAQVGEDTGDEVFDGVAATEDLGPSELALGR